MQNDSQKGRLGSKFEHFNATPSDGLWDAIANSLDEKNKRKGIVWWWVGPGIAAILLVTILSVDFSKDATPLTRQSQIYLTKNIPENRDKMTHHSLVAAPAKYKSNILNSPLKKVSLTQLVKPKEDVKEVRKQPQKKALQKAAGSKKTVQLKQPLKNEITEGDSLNTWPLSKLNLIAFSPNTSIQPLLNLDRNKSNDWAFGFGYGAWQSFERKLKPADNEAAENFNQVVQDSIGAINANWMETNEYYRTTRPIGLLFYCSYSIRPRLRVRSGLNVEYVKYKLSYNPNEIAINNITSNQVFGVNQLVLGLPLGVEYDFLRGRRFRVGIGSHVLNEIPIIERLTVNPMNEKQFALSYNLGLQTNLNFIYNLNERTKIQLNPGVRWYAIQNSKVFENLPRRSLLFGGSVNLIWNF